MRRGGAARGPGPAGRGHALPGGPRGIRGAGRGGPAPGNGGGLLRDRGHERDGGEGRDRAADPVRRRLREGGGPRGAAHHGGLEGGLRRVKHFDVITIFPEMLEAVARHGITRRSLEDGLFGLKTWDPRDFTTDAYRRVDDRPYGGGPGMVMMAEPLEAAIDAAVARQRDAGVGKPLVALTSPQGERLTERVVRELDAVEGLVIVAGRYEGVDERLVERRIDREISIGDYVTSGGELPAMVLIDCLVRRLPGSLNDARSATEDSFSGGLLDW